MSGTTQPPRSAAERAIRYAVEHDTRYVYTDPVTQSWQLAHLMPRDSPWQELVSHSLWIDPVADRRREGTDSFGNSNLHFALHRAHRELHVSMRCSVAVHARAPVASPCSEAWERVRDRVLREPTLDGLNAARLREPTRLLPLSRLAREYAQRSFEAGRDWFEAVQGLMHSIHRDFEYDPGATTVSTSVDEVLGLRRGVCQDFAHLMLAGLRSLGLPARYVSGYLLTQAAPGEPRLLGVDASHAWVAAYAPGCGWVEFDPTNDQLADQRYITLAWGGDFADVMPLRGVLLGGGEQEMQVSVSVLPLAP